MANSTDPFARTIHGTNPQNLVEKIVRTKIYQNNYWKEQCFGLTAETLVDKAMELDHLGGTYGGNRRPTPFMCLVLKMLQIQPDKDIVVEFIKNEDYKYVRILGAFYLRITGTMADVYQYLEPLYNDYRKLRRKLNDGNFSLIHVDEFIDELLTQDSSCDIALPRLQKRMTLEGTGVLEPRRSALEDDFEEEEENEEDKKAQAMDIDDHHKDHHRGRSPIKDRERDRDRDRDGGRDRDRESHRDRDRDRYKNRDRDDRDYERVRDRDRDIDRDRDRDRYKERERRERDRDRGRYRSRSRDRRDRERDEGEERRRRARGTPSPQREERKKKKEKKEKKEMKSDGTDHPDPEIAEANKLRASLGLKPLRV